MKTNEFSALRKEAKKEVKNYATSPFKIINDLNKSAKKNEYCNGKPVAEVAKLLRTKSGGRYAFTADSLRKDSQGRFVRSCKLPKVWSYDTDGDHVMYTYHGCDIEGNTYLRPIAATLPAYFDAFCAIVAAEIRENEKAQKAFEKAQKQAQRLRTIERKDILRRLNTDSLPEYEQAALIERLKELNKVA